MNSRPQLIYPLAAGMAVICGVGVGTGNWVTPMLIVAVLGAAFLSWASPRHLDARLLSVLLIGYVAGNRGFAQLSPVGGVPLFPAEIGLALGVTVLLWRQAREKRLIGWGDELSAIVLLWMAANTVRFVFDFRAHGFAALRDFAMVYYAGFFFVAMAAAEGVDANWPARAMRWATAALLPLTLLVEAFPAFFFETLTVRGIPLIFLKGDLAGLFMAAGVLLWWRFYEEKPGRWWAIAVSLALVAGVLGSENRSSMLGLGAGVAWFALAGAWRLVQVLLAAAVIGVAGILLWAHANDRSWEETPVHEVVEIMSSIADLSGAGGPSTSAAVKGDNNRFRTTWWRKVIEETTDTNPWTGMGYGHDLAEGFLREYYPGEASGFLARSPHNVWVTVFARSGAVGLILFAAMIGLIGWRTWIVARSGDRAGLQLWAAGWVLLVGATFGVVLEGPMGAVVFWTLLGAGNQRYREALRGAGPLSGERS